MKKFHGTPVGGTQEDAMRFLSGRDALISFYTQGHVPEVLACANSFILDNGAFSHWKAGKGNIDIPAYVKWIEHLSKHPGHYFSIIPDVIGGTEEENERMLQEFLDKNTSKSYAPVYHLGESLDRFFYLAEKFDIVCLGSTDKWGANNSASWWKFMAEFMDNAMDKDGRPPCKLHGLRMLDPRVFTKLPLHSADSTNASVNNHLCLKKGVYPDLKRWQGSIRIAQRVEHWQSAPVWVNFLKESKDEVFNLV